MSELNNKYYLMEILEKKTKSKKRGYLYPYGHSYRYDHDDNSSDYGDFGFDAGGDGGGK